MGILSKRIANIKDLTSAVSGSNARLITNNNFKYLSGAIVDIINELQIDGGSTPIVTTLTASGLIRGGTFANTGGSFTVNAMGQMLAQGGIYTPLAHISRLRLDPDPTTIAIQAGEIRWSGSDFLGWNGTQWLSFTNDFSENDIQDLGIILGTSIEVDTTKIHTYVSATLTATVTTVSVDVLSPPPAVGSRLLFHFDATTAVTVAFDGVTIYSPSFSLQGPVGSSSPDHYVVSLEFVFTGQLWVRIQ